MQNCTEFIYFGYSSRHELHKISKCLWDKASRVLGSSGCVSCTLCSVTWCNILLKEAASCREYCCHEVVYMVCNRESSLCENNFYFSARTQPHVHGITLPQFTCLLHIGHPAVISSSGEWHAITQLSTSPITNTQMQMLERWIMKTSGVTLKWWDL